jgi:hypothetical protein
VEVKVGEFSANAAGRAASYYEQKPGAIDGFTVTAPGVDPADAQSLRWP